MPSFEETDRMALQAGYTPRRRKIVCLCGSTKFWRLFQRAGLEETMRGNIVLSIGAASGTDDDHFGNLAPEAYNAIKNDLDTLHYDKIAMADEILVLDDLRDGRPYIGTSTAAEIAFATRMGKGIRYWSWEHFLEPAPEKIQPDDVAKLKNVAMPDGTTADIFAVRLDRAWRMVDAAADWQKNNPETVEILKRGVFTVGADPASNDPADLYVTDQAPADGEYMPLESADQLKQMIAGKAARINEQVRRDLNDYAGILPEPGDLAPVQDDGGPADRLVVALYETGQGFKVETDQSGEANIESKDAAIAKTLTILNDYAGPRQPSPNDITFEDPYGKASQDDFIGIRIIRTVLGEKPDYLVYNVVDGKNTLMPFDNIDAAFDYLFNYWQRSHQPKTQPVILPGQYPIDKDFRDRVDPSIQSVIPNFETAVKSAVETSMNLPFDVAPDFVNAEQPDPKTFAKHDTAGQLDPDDREQFTADERRRMFLMYNDDRAPDLKEYLHHETAGDNDDEPTTGGDDEDRPGGAYYKGLADFVNTGNLDSTVQDLDRKTK